MWVISVVWTLWGSAVQIWDSIIANIDTPWSTASNWNILNSNIAYVPEDVANKATTMTGNTTSNILYLTAKAIYDWVVGWFVALTGEQTIIWVKTFTLFPVTPSLAPFQDYQVANKLYVDNSVSTAVSNFPVTSVTYNVNDAFLTEALENIDGKILIPPVAWKVPIILSFNLFTTVGIGSTEELFLMNTIWWEIFSLWANALYDNNTITRYVPPNNTWYPIPLWTWINLLASEWPYSWYSWKIKIIYTYI